MSGVYLNVGVNNGTFSSAMKQMSNEMKNLQNSFMEASTKAKLFGTAQDQLKVKQQELTAKMSLYAEQVKKLENIQGNLTTKLDKQKKTQADLAKEIEKTKKAYADSVKATGESSKESEKLAKELQKLEKEYNANEKALTKTETEMTKANSKMTEFKTHIMECGKALEDTNKKLSSAKFEEVGEKFKSTGEKIGKVGSALKPVATGLAGIGVASAKVGMDFDYAMSDLSATSGATGEDFEKLRNKAKELGATTCKSATDSAAAMKYLALSGQDVNQILQTTEPTLKASVAFGEDLARTADLETDSMSALGLSVDDLTHYLDICGQAQRSSNTTASQLMEAYIGCGGTLRNFGVSTEESATILGIMANQGLTFRPVV